MNLSSISPWIVWTILALIFGILEVGVPLFAFLFAAVAAVITAGVSLKLDWPAQIGSFLISTVVLVAVLRPRFLQRWQKHHHMPSRSQELVGAQGTVTEAVDPVTGTGRILVEGQDWAARSHNPISVGKTIKVENHDGIVLIIKEI